ncbi:MAG: RNA polymerase sigma factor, partial [Candidatus Limnocylindria bacterium]
MRRATQGRDPFADSSTAFDAWVSPHLPVMASLAARLTSDSERDDVVQEALLRAWKKRSQYDARRGSVRTWLLAITADQARRTRRRARPTSVLADLSVPGRPLDERLDLERAVLRLSPRQRLAVDCYYFVDLSITETAAVMRCAPGTVKSTLADARHRLKELL